MFRLKAGQLAKSVGRRALSTSEAAGVKVSSVDDGRAVSELSLLVKAGPRFETTPGVANLLEKFAFHDTAAKSGLRLQREAELLGGSLSTSLTREYIVLHAKFLREDLPYFVSALANTSRETLFRKYELDEQVLPEARLQSAALSADPAVLAIDAAYEAAFRRGLGNSTLLSPASPVSLEQIKDYATKAYTKGNVSIFGRGVSHSDFEHFVGDNFAALSDGAALTSPKAEAFSGEARIKHSGVEQVAVIAFPTTTRPCLEVLKHVLQNKSTKWNTGNGVLDQISAKYPGTYVKVHNDTFSDASLFSIIIRGADPASVSSVAKESAAALKKLAGGIDKDVISRAIARSKVKAADASLYPALAPSVDLSSVTDATVKAKVEALLKGKTVLSVVGKTRSLPYLDELF